MAGPIIRVELHREFLIDSLAAEAAATMRAIARKKSNCPDCICQRISQMA